MYDTTLTYILSSAWGATMVIVSRRIAGIVRYEAIYFPNESTIREIAENLSSTRIARLFFTPYNLAGARCVIARYLARTSCVNLDNSSDSLWQAMDATCRRQIRRAEKLAERVKIERNGANGAQDFLPLLNALAVAKRDVATISAQQLAMLGSNRDIFMLYLDGKPQGGHLFLQDSEAGRARMLHSANRRLQAPEQARLLADLNRLLHWHEIQFYRDQGIKLYDFGGISNDPHDGVARFKLSFGGDTREEYIYFCAGIPRFGRAAKLIFETFTERGRGWRNRAEIAPNRP
jgi:FemAB family